MRKHEMFEEFCLHRCQTNFVSQVQRACWCLVTSNTVQGLALGEK